MPDYRKIQLVIDAESGRLVNRNGTRITRADDLPRLLFGDLAAVCVELVAIRETGGVKTLAPIELAESSEYRLLGAVPGTGELLFRSDSDGVNLPGSWPDGSDPDPGAGQLTFLINTGTVNFREALSGREKRKCDFALTATAAGSLDISVLAKDGFTAENRPDADAGAALSDNFVTVQQLAAYFKAESGFEFSPDAVEWHSERALSDLYYRPADHEEPLIFCIGPAAPVIVSGVTETEAAAIAVKAAVKQALIFG